MSMVWFITGSSRGFGRELTRAALAAGDAVVATARRPEVLDALVAVDPQPSLLQTSRPGVFAVGDVRSGSVKRVASAVGEGAMAVRLLHEHLARSGGIAGQP